MQPMMKGRNITVQKRFVVFNWNVLLPYIRFQQKQAKAWAMHEPGRAWNTEKMNGPGKHM